MITVPLFGTVDPHMFAFGLGFSAAISIGLFRKALGWVSRAANPTSGT